MPIEIRFADNRLGVVLRTVGSVSSREFIDTHVAFFHENKRALATIRYWYSDFSDADAFDVTSERSSASRRRLYGFGACEYDRDRSNLCTANVRIRSFKNVAGLHGSDRLDNSGL